MDSRYIKEFVVLAETCSFQETAERMYISQSSLSKHIRKVEEELGVSLFDRTTRNVRLNEYGSLFYQYARQITDLHEAYSSAINEMQMNDDSRISIGFLARLGPYGIIETLSAFAKEYPEDTLDMIESKTPEDLLLQKKCDFIFTAGETSDNTGLKKQLYKTDHLVVLLPSDHPLANEERVSIDQLRNEKFIMHGEASGNSLETSNFKKLCQETNFKPDVSMTVIFTSSIIKLVSQGMGIAVLNKSQAPAASTTGVKVVDLYPLVPYHIYILSLENQKMTSAKLDFLDFVEHYQA